MNPVIKQARKDLVDAQTRLSSLVANCHHRVTTIEPPKSARYDWFDDKSAKCEDCGIYMGWYCPDSPTHTCKYEEDEMCVFCDMPEERK